MLQRFPHNRLSHRLLLFAAATFFVPLPAAFASKDSVPDWVRAAMTQPQGKYSPETAAVVLLDETIFTVGNDGKAVEHNRHVVKILRPSGREQAIVDIPYDKDSKILSLHVWSVGPDGHEYALKDNEIEDFGYPGSGGLYNDDREMVAKAPGRDPGGVVAYEYEQRARPYMNEANWFFQDDIPHLQQSFTLQLPANFAYAVSWAHHDAVKAIDLEHQRTRWEIAETPGIDLEHVPLRPSLMGLSGRMTLHYGPAGQAAAPLDSWQGVGAWYDALARDRMVATPDIAVKATELTSGKSDFYDKTEAIAEFVQKDIRYFVIEKGIGGLQPHPASDIFRNRYGDCKDKATLLSAMLSSVGVRSVIVLVDTHRGFIDPAAPSSLGNHAIGAIEIPADYKSTQLRSVITAKTGKRYLIVDPTSEKTPYGQLEHDLQGSYGVLVDGKESEVVQLPILDPALNTIHRTAKLQLKEDGSLEGAITEKRFGDISAWVRYLYTQGNAKEQQSYLDKRLSQDFTSFKTTDVKVSDVTALNKEVTTTYNLSAERYGRTMGGLLMVRPRVYGSEGFEFDRKPRTVPIDLDETMTATDDFTIELPPGYALDEIPNPVKLDMGFAAYESSSRLTGNELHYTRTYIVRELTLPASRYGEVQKLAGAIDADEQNHAVLKKK
jgi:hypothetical protein